MCRFFARAAMPFVLFLAAGALGAVALPIPTSPVIVHALLWRDSPDGPLGTALSSAVDRFNRQNAGIFSVVPEWVAPRDTTARLAEMTRSGRAWLP